MSILLIPHHHLLLTMDLIDVESPCTNCDHKSTSWDNVDALKLEQQNFSQVKFWTKSDLVCHHKNRIKIKQGV
jgi:hypothetical protein